jgi:F0F1-type ATP synthase assembly protein I
MTKPTEPGRDPSPFEAMEMVWDLLFAIAVPTVLFALGGRWLDRRFHLSPLFTIVGLILSILVIAITIKRKGETLQKRLYPK